jgi:hypothetical protein
VQLADGGMTAHELVLHLTNVMAFAIASVSRTDRIRHEALEWPLEIARFYSQLRDLDAKLAEGAEVEDGMELRLVQGPLADALTHVGQLHALRRKAGVPVGPTNYIKADVQIGRTGLDEQAD